MCIGAESKFFNGHTNIKNDRFVVFGVKGLLEASKNIRNVLLFNILRNLKKKVVCTDGKGMTVLL